MLALGLQGSPRKKGNSDLLLAMFMEELARRGVATHTLPVCQMKIEPCKELTVCERNGTCPIEDDMAAVVYPLLRQADIVVAATPVFFYSVSAQIKALIDRCQLYWARKYILKIRDPGHVLRRGFLLAVGASGGKQLFDGLHLTAKYFFDAIDAEYAGHLTYKKVEARGAIKNHPGVVEDVTRAVDGLLGDLARRPKILFIGAPGDSRISMAAAFLKLHGGRKYDVAAAAESVTALTTMAVEKAMAEKGIDVGYPIIETFAAVCRVPGQGSRMRSGTCPQCRNLTWKGCARSVRPSNDG
jgi:multimeric flavodoxin WrbA